MPQPKKSLKQLAVIRETECIGCTKCIQACPVDAIFGASNQMHTVIVSECIGCKLCVPVCPVDCIDLIYHPDQNRYPEKTKQRYKYRIERLDTEETANLMSLNKQNVYDKQTFIKEALQRKRKKDDNN